MPKVRRQRKSSSRRKTTKPSCSTSEPSSSECSTLSGQQPPEVSGHSACSSAALELVEGLKELCRAEVATHHESKAHATWMEKYMRNQFTFLGIKSPLRRQIQATFVESHGDRLKGDRALLLEFVSSLWDETEREFQYFGQELLKKYRKEVLGSSDADFDEAMALTEKLIVRKSWWDTVDTLSGSRFRFVAELYYCIENIYSLSLFRCGVLCS